METRDLTGWINSQRDTLDKIIAETAEDYSRVNSSAPNGSWFAFDLKETSEELFLPANRKDLCYDRPTIGLTYSLWFHARRVNQLLQGLLSTLPSVSDPHIEIFDLGGGTGALLWAAGLVYAAMKEEGLNPPKLTVINIDSSPFMLRYGELLWRKFTGQYPSCREIKTIYKLDSWHTEGEEFTKPWLSASYLFDADEDKESVTSDFSKKVESMSPDHILLLTSKGKRSVFNEVIARVTKLQPVGYRVESSEGEFLFRGGLSQVRNFRIQANEEFGTDFKGYPKWIEGEFLYAVLRREQASLAFGGGSVADASSGQAVLKVSLSRPPAKRRSDLTLNEKQAEAASHTEQPTIIVGPAGSGKSIILAERIKNLVAESDYDPSLRILLTTFNKQLLYNQLRPWLRDLLDGQKAFLQHNPKLKGLGFKFEGSAHFNIDILHFDVLPSRLGRIFGQQGEDELCELLNGVISQARKSLEGNGSDLTNLDRILEPDFILEEFNRVFYGLEYFDEHTYLTKERAGRGSRPRMPVLQDCFIEFDRVLRDGEVEDWETLRSQVERYPDAFKRRGEPNDYSLPGLGTIPGLLPTTILAYTSGSASAWEEIFEPQAALTEYLWNATSERERPWKWDLEAERRYLTEQGLKLPENLIEETGTGSLSSGDNIYKSSSVGMLVLSDNLKLAVCAVTLAQAIKDFKEMSDAPGEKQFLKEIENSIEKRKPMSGLRGILNYVDWLYPVTIGLRIRFNIEHLSNQQIKRLARLYRCATSVLPDPMNQPGRLLLFDLRHTSPNKEFEDQNTAEALAEALGEENSKGPFAVFRTLQSWRASGLLEDVTISLRKRKLDDLLLYDWLSDGERMFLGRMALLHLMRAQEDSLILLDEPETHFNDYWKRQIVDVIDDNLRDTPSEVVISTHSSIALTDVFDTEITLLKKASHDGSIYADEPSIQTFGASPSEIMRKIFDAEDIVGQRANEFLDMVLKIAAHPKQVESVWLMFDSMQENGAANGSSHIHQTILDSKDFRRLWRLVENIHQYEDETRLYHLLRSLRHYIRTTEPNVNRVRVVDAMRALEGKLGPGYYRFEFNRRLQALEEQEPSASPS